MKYEIDFETFELNTKSKKKNKIRPSFPSPFRGGEGRGKLIKKIITETMSKKINKIRGEHGLNFFISYQLKKRLQTLARKYDTSLAEMVRTLLKIGIPVLEGYRLAQEEAEKAIGKLNPTDRPEQTSPPPSPTGEGVFFPPIRGEGEGGVEE